MFLTLTAVDISVVFTAKSLAVEELGVGALLHVLGEGAVVAGILLVGTVVVQLALLGVGNQISVVPGAVRVDGERQGRDGVGWCCR